MRLLRVRRGSLLLEAVVAIGFFAVFLSGIGLTLIVGERTTIVGGDRVRATFLAERALEGVRQMRNQAPFSTLWNVADVTEASAVLHGVNEISGAWQIGQPLNIGGYTSVVKLIRRGSGGASDWIEAQSAVTWNFGQTRSGSVILTTSLTDWRRPGTAIDCARMPKLGEVVGSGAPDYHQIAVAAKGGGIYAYVTGSTAGGGGLTVFDVTNPLSPSQLASVDLGFSVYGIAVNPNRNQLYLATDDPGNEFQVFNIPDTPVTLSLADRVGSHNINGVANGQARSIATPSANVAYRNTVAKRDSALLVPAAHAQPQCAGTKVFLGTLRNDDVPEFYALGVESDGAVSLCDEQEVNWSVYDIGLQAPFAYLATDSATAEIRIIDIFNPSNITLLPPSDGSDLAPGSGQPLAIAAFGTGVFLSRANSGGRELVRRGTVDAPTTLANIGSQDLGADGTAVMASSDEQCVYVGRDTSAGQQIEAYTTATFQGTPPQFSAFSYTIDAISDPGVDYHVRSLLYDSVTRKLYAVTANALIIFEPGA